MLLSFFYIYFYCQWFLLSWYLTNQFLLIIKYKNSCKTIIIFLCNIISKISLISLMKSKCCNCWCIKYNIKCRISIMFSFCIITYRIILWIIFSYCYWFSLNILQWNFKFTFRLSSLRWFTIPSPWITKCNTITILT
jgi:hypothetical protein